MFHVGPFDDLIKVIVATVLVHCIFKVSHGEVEVEKTENQVVDHVSVNESFTHRINRILKFLRDGVVNAFLKWVHLVTAPSQTAQQAGKEVCFTVDIFLNRAICLLMIWLTDEFTDDDCRTRASLKPLMVILMTLLVVDQVVNLMMVLDPVLTNLLR